jgi:hypothetical protein
MQRESHKSLSPRPHKKSRNESPQRENELLIEGDKGNEKDIGDSFKSEIEYGALSN